MPANLATRGLRTARSLLLLAVLAIVLPVSVCFAHPMGNFSVNHYARITLEKDGIQLRYFIDLAEIPTYQELQQYNLTPGDTAAQAAFLAARGAELEHGLVLRIDGVPVVLHMVSKGVIFPPGAGGLPTMKLGYVFHADYPSPHTAAAADLAYADNNYPGHAGWKEIVVTGPASLALTTTAAAKDRSDELSNYPTDLLNTAPQDLTATARFTYPVLTAQTPPGAAVSTPLTSKHLQPAVSASATRPVAEPPAHNLATTHATVAPAPRKAAAIAASQSAVSTPQLTAPAPMHLEGNRQGTSRSAFTQLVTQQHLSLWFLFTAAFISMGLGALHALEPGHGKTIVAAYLVGSRGTARHAMLLGIIVTVAHTASVFALGAITLYASRYILPEQLYPWLGILSGLTIAALGAYMLLRRWTGAEVEHTHAAGQMHGHWFSSKTNQPAQTNESNASTISGITTLSSAAPKPVSLLQLLTLGITGGIIPCPAALVVLLSAFALHRVGFGFFLITAFSIGLAAVLIGFGLLMVYARRFMSRLQVDGPLTRRWLPVASAGFMTILGLIIAVRAAATTGLTLHSFSREKLGPALFVAGLGLVLGIRHSTDTDHVVAISTIVTRQRSIRGAALIGSLWGLGHTLTIFIVGCLIILCGVVIPPRIGLAMEFSVGLMLILLGVLNLTGVMQKLVTRFTPARTSTTPDLATGAIANAGAFTGSASTTEAASSIPADGLLSAPVFTGAASAPPPHITPRTRLFAGAFSRYGSYQLLRPLAIGLVHGLAGSAAVALLVLSTIHSPLWAILYLVIFGGGTMLGMMCMTAAMAMPLIYAGDRMPQVSRYLGVASGLVSVCFGSFLVYQLGYLGGLFSSHPHWIPQ